MDSLPLVGDGEPLAPARATPRQHNAAVLRRHANAEAMSLLPPTLVRLIRALALHVSRCRGPGCPVRARPESRPAAGFFGRCRGETPPVWAKLQCYAARLVAVNVGQTSLRRLRAKDLTRGSLYFHSSAESACATVPFPSRPGGETYGWDWVPPQDFHKLWKRLWKSTRAVRRRTPGQVNCRRFEALPGSVRGRLPARCTYGSQYLGPNPLQNRNES